VANILDHDLGTLVRQTHEAHGVKISSRSNTRSNSSRHVQLDDGTKLDCDLVVVGIGVRPNTKLLKETGLATDNGFSQ